MEPAEYTHMDAAEHTMWWYRALHARLCDALAPVTGRVLDAGCGTGGFLAVLGAARPDLSRFGCEWDPAAARRAAEKSAAPVARGSVNALPFAAASLDAMVSADVLCHEAVEPAAALAEAARVLKPGGRLVINMPAYMWLHAAHDIRVRNARRSTAGEVRRWLVAAGFEPVKIGYWNGLLLPLMVAQRKIMARRRHAPSDVVAFSPRLDHTLHAITEMERGWNLPAGGSVLAIAARPLPGD